MAIMDSLRQRISRLLHQHRLSSGTASHGFSSGRSGPPDEPLGAPVGGPILQEGQIDVRDLIARFDFAEHAKLADAYFAPLLNSPVIRRKPFAHLGEAIQIMGAFSQLLDGMRLFKEARVLDFGAGTCWSSRILASLGSHVTALDVSSNALQIAKSIQEQDPVTRELPIEYQVFDGRTLPIGDGVLDRIACFDSFHHVADQKSALEEFSRVLNDSGIVGFAEPGPNHSLTPSSQMEMKAYNVIENDIRVEEIWDIARSAGFADIKLSFVMPRQELVSLADFNIMLRQQSAPNRIVFSPNNSAIHQNRRVFFLFKSLSVETDSRSPEGLQYKLKLVSAAVVQGTVDLVLSVSNVGPSVWRASGDQAGSVNIGVHLRGENGQTIDNDFARLPISSDRVMPGQDITISTKLELPKINAFEFELDLVSESVTWFEVFRNIPLRLAFRSGQFIPGVKATTQG